MPLMEQYAFRRALTDALIRDIVGPSTEDETIDDDPITRYASGILYPAKSGTLDPALDNEAPESQDSSVVSQNEGVDDPAVALANVHYPASMGITFAVSSRDAKCISLQVRAARYVQAEATEAEAPAAADAQPRRAGPKRRWKREPLTIPPIEIDITAPNSGIPRRLVAPGLELFCRIRSADADDIVSVTLALVNTHAAKLDLASRSADSFFQVELSVAAAEAPAGAFAERPSHNLLHDDEDLKAYRLLYRHAREFAVGHGCSVQWEVREKQSDRAVSITTTYAPEYAVPLADSNPEIKLHALKMRYLAEAPREEVVRELEPLWEEYKRWIGEKSGEATLLAPEYQETAQSHLEACKEALERMRRGIRLLASDDKVWLAFRLADKAMLQQRARSVWLRSGRQAPGPTESDEHAWHPFQLAFILLCLESLAVPDSPDRTLADLLWFPTGGGKTEAYLGLIAFTVFLRRLRLADGGGVTALMRYTLRLLTVQQFERAALLICCCEAVRRTEMNLGTAPISIGLWVGGGLTPNTLTEARTALNKLRQGIIPDEGNPVQLHSCPWCGVPLDHRNYWIATDPKRLIVACKNSSCLFERILPVFLVDEDVYVYRPTLLIATVDKFAGLPWREQSGDLFNHAGGGRPLQAPPELIIQDELHLISGPLGTLTGLYETAVDRLCTTTAGIRPKVIASTATIRRARQQALALFNRDVRQFPPPGIDARDSYFAVEAPPERRGTRLYVGLMAPGTSHTTLLVRTYAALLQYAQELPGAPDVKDPYWTLVGYFNSLRVLAGAVMQVQDDVKDRMNLIAAGPHLLRTIEPPIELNSNTESGKIPEYLKRMADTLATGPALDVILATNMISVGVDIDRLGLMAVMGQPQSTSEYIQATSRVGRRYPGLVVVLFNAARSRDRSHYESFAAYHSALYRQVESTSVTPFSTRARDRGLHAVLVTLARLLDPRLHANGDARLITAQRPHLAPIVDLIVERVRQISPDEAAATRARLNELLDDWEKRAGDTPSLKYRDQDVMKSLLIDAASDDSNADEFFRTLWSLRDVDRASNLFLVH